MNTTATETIYLSKKGMKELKKTITQLERDLRRTIIDLHEQDKTDSHDGRLARIEKMAQRDAIQTELDEKRTLLMTAKPYPRKRDALYAGIGSVVELIDTNGRKFCYTLVDSIEANPSDGRISIKSPLGQNLIGKIITDTINWGNDFRRTQLQLIRIS